MMSSEKLELANSADATAAAAAWLDRLAEQNSFPPKLVAHLQIMLEEVMANLWEHGGEGTRSIHLTLALDPEWIRLTFFDDGQPFDLRGVEASSVGTNLADARVGGLGLQLIKKFADQIDYRSENGWNRLTLAKKRPVS